MEYICNGEIDSKYQNQYDIANKVRQRGTNRNVQAPGCMAIYRFCKKGVLETRFVYESH